MESTRGILYTRRNQRNNRLCSQATNNYRSRNRNAGACFCGYCSLSPVRNRKQSIKVPTRFGVQYHAYNVADPKVIQFIKDVLDEVCNLFPSETIHIGGDEVKYDQWKKSAQVRNFMKEQNIKTPADLQIWFTNTISHYLENKKST